MTFDQNEIFPKAEKPDRTEQIGKNIRNYWNVMVMIGILTRFLCIDELIVWLFLLIRFVWKFSWENIELNQCIKMRMSDKPHSEQNME